MTMKSFIMFFFILQSVQAVRLKTVNNEDFTTTWGGATCTGTCSAVTCSIDNSNQQAGSASACGEGYAATMGWSGATPSRSGSAMTCSIINSTVAYFWLSQSDCFGFFCLCACDKQIFCANTKSAKTVNFCERFSV